jgi:DNA gyrase subunit B
LDILENVRQRPGMFLGSTDSRGVYAMLCSLVDSALNAYLAGEGKTITVSLRSDGSICVSSDTIIFPLPSANDLSGSLQELFLRPTAGEIDWNKWNVESLPLNFAGPQGDYRVGGYRSGAELCIVSALSQSLIVEIRQGGKNFRQEFRDQQPVGNALVLPAAMETATIVTFFPDETIFEETWIAWEDVYQYLAQSSYLLPGLALRLMDERHIPARVHDFPATNDIVQYLLNLTTGQKRYLPLRPIRILDEQEHTKVHIALQYSLEHGNVFSFVNNYRTQDGGTHVAGFLDALRYSLMEFSKLGTPSKTATLPPSRESITTHLTAVVSIWTPNPRLESPTRSRLSNPEVRQHVREVTKKALLYYFEQHPVEVQRILTYLPQGRR